MVLEITKDHEPQDLWVADRRLWLTADKSKAVEDGDPRAAFLLCTPGRSIPRPQAEALGLVKPPVVPKPEVKEAEKPADKAQTKPVTKEKKKPARRKRT